jgi:hypothetical protein
MAETRCISTETRGYESVVPPSMRRFALPGLVIGVIGVIITLTLWRVGGLVVLMIGAVLLLAAKFVRSNELSDQRQSRRLERGPGSG